MTGYVQLHRSIWNHPLFVGEPFSRREAWLWMISHAAWKPHRAGVRRARTQIMIDLGRGELIASRSHLAGVFGWGEQRVRTFLKQLEKEGMIALRINQQINVVTICNYEKFQEAQPRINQQSNLALTAHQPRTNHTEEGEEVKEEKIYVNEQPTDCSLTLASAEEDLLGEQVKPGRSKPQPIAEAFHRYNQMAERCGLQQASSLSPKRRTSIGARLREHGLDGWDQMLSMVERSSFLRGQVEGRDFRANLDWLIKPTNFVKVFEGNYGNGAHAASADEPTMSVDELRESLRAQGYTDEQLENLQ